MAELCSLDDIKSYLNKADKDGDELLNLMIPGVSARMIAAMPRFSIAHTVTSEPQHNIGLPEIVIDEPPITASANITTVVDGATTLASANYRLEGDDTIVRLNDSGFVTPWINTELYFTYTSGYDPADLPDDIVLAAMMQVAFEWRLSRHGDDRLGTEGSSPREGDGTTFRDETWVESVADTMRLYGADIPRGRS